MKTQQSRSDRRPLETENNGFGTFYARSDIKQIDEDGHTVYEYTETEMDEKEFEIFKLEKEVIRNKTKIFELEMELEELKEGKSDDEEDE